jgi:peptidyl-tRNA hydrolase, PTH1 family
MMEMITNTMHLVVGLGNPGEKYSRTLHNVGFIFVDRFVAAGQASWSKWKNSLVAKTPEAMYFKPQAYMNNSGDCVAQYLNFFKDAFSIKDLIVVHDDVDLEFGKIKAQFGASSAGHKGVQSIIDHLGTQDFWRIRVGVGRPENPNIETEDWVLTSFSKERHAEILAFDIASLISDISEKP